MKKRFAWIVIAILLSSGCARLPVVNQAQSSKIQEIRDHCSASFPRGNWQFVHAIQATMPGGQTGVMMGVTEIYPDTGGIHCVMMTIEGLVMFDAGYADGRIVINRGIPPFESRNFAQGVMDDIRLMFFRPANESEEIGFLKDGQPLCRYSINSHQTLDILIAPPDSWTIRLYENQRPVKVVNAFGHVVSGQDNFPQRIELIATGKYPYRLDFTFLEATPLSQ